MSGHDVWNVETFDEELHGDLDVQSDIVRDYMITSSRQCLEREASDRKMPYPGNPYAGEFNWVTERIMRLMEARTIRAWHYTRMTDAEIGALRQRGIYLSTLDNIRLRFAAQVAAGVFSQEIADRLFADSPYQSDQRDSRSNKFWMVSHPVDIEDGSVELLLERWGGEAAYFCQQDPSLQDLLKRIGRPRVLEIAMPLVHSDHGLSAAEAVVATFGRTLGCRPDQHVFDLYTYQPLGAAHILGVHSEGEPNFGTMARGYPVGFVDVNTGRWNEK